MASIKISELRPAGSELFQDSESFLTELSESRELAQVLGGWTYYNNQQSNSIVTKAGNTLNANTYGNANTVVGNA
ncbi:hypothetical protein [Nostoc sp. UHCC 0251]|uniref:hypothetical protein n=1 Tax=Nostoc sp. UHCC 0251 TaxID=3110240 RepID=UPI002B1EE92B|nr:hypothetical protein [Nostoc sp. UHCC 0251]MEA5626257.1 hypothetical protein [Nostoc sp. UHCC 0251]